MRDAPLGSESQPTAPGDPVDDRGGTSTAHWSDELQAGELVAWAVVAAGLAGIAIRNYVGQFLWEWEVFPMVVATFAAACIGGMWGAGRLPAGLRVAIRVVLGFVLAGIVLVVLLAVLIAATGPHHIKLSLFVPSN